MSNKPQQVVVVTGASAGIGRALSDLLAQGGGKYRVVLAARREAQLQEAVAAFGKASGDANDATYVVADVTQRADVERVAAHALAKFQRIDVWVNNAGAGSVVPVTRLEDAELDTMMKVNVYSALYGMQTAVKQFKAQGTAAGQPAKGVVINVSSLLGRNATFAPTFAAYNAAKHCLNGLTDSLRAELQAEDATRGIRVVTVSPGLTATEFGVAMGGPDFRSNPSAQPVKGVAAVLQRAIDDPAVEDVYTLPKYKQWIDDFIVAKGRES